MSMLQVLDTLLAAFEDDAIGLSTQVQKLNAATGRDVRADFGFCKWVVRQALRDTRTPSVTIYPFTGADEVAVKQMGHADNVQEVVVAVEYFDADPEKRQDAIALIQAAVIAVLVELLDFVEAQPAPVSVADLRRREPSDHHLRRVRKSAERPRRGLQQPHHSQRAEQGMSNDTQADANRETIVVAVGPNVDGHAQQAVASQTRPADDAAVITEEGARDASAGHITEG
jgi:hypothetical protein